jgi:hypothetical protein
VNELSTSTGGALPRSRLLRWLLVGGALCGVVYVVLMFVPIYHVEYERDETGGAIEFLKKLQALQAEHLLQHGRYLGDEDWAEWPTGPFPSEEGVAWGKPTAGVWAQVHLRLRPKLPVLFKFRLRASELAERAPQDLLPLPPTGPWYIAQARADLDGDQVIWLIEVSSAGAAIYIENSGD